MQAIENIILNCLKQINGERTIYSIYHLLNGKKSSQTIQDAHFFSIKRYFRIFESLSRESFEELIHCLYEKKFIVVSGEQRYQITKLAEESMNKNIIPQFINGWEFHQMDSIFWERMSFFIQVISNLVYQESQYIPIQKNKEIHNWLKTAIKKINIPKSEIGSTLLSELFTCFDAAKDINPNVLVLRLTGFQKIGLTASQTAQRLNMNHYDYHIEFLNTLHYFIQRVRSNARGLSLLPILLDDLEQFDYLTNSTRKTLELLNDGFSVHEIAQIRNLKANTVEDHLVELALNLEGFSIDSFVDEDQQKKIIETSRKASTRQLKLIRNELETVSYFQIRLCLAKHG